METLSSAGSTVTADVGMLDGTAIAAKVEERLYLSPGNERRHT